MSEQITTPQNAEEGLSEEELEDVAGGVGDTNNGCNIGCVVKP